MARGGFLLDNNSVYIEGGATIFCPSKQSPEIKICSGRDCTDTNATYLIGSATSYSTWDTEADGPVHDASQVYVPPGHTIDLGDTSNRSWISYKLEGVYGEK